MRLLLVSAIFLVACGGGDKDDAEPGDATAGDATLDGPSAPRDAAVDAGFDAARDGAPEATDAASDVVIAPHDAGRSVLQHHNRASRDGMYVDPGLTKDAAQRMHRDTSFDGAIDGVVLAQPLYVEAGPGGKKALYVVTEKNQVYALDMNGAVLWSRVIATPVPLAKLPCGYLDPLGISGTPVIDFVSRTMVLDAMTTPDDGTTKKHFVYALSLDDGATRPGWPVDLSASVVSHGVAFNSPDQMQRGALALVDGVVYVPFGGHHGDCGDYHGWVVAVPLADPAHPTGWATDGIGGGIWGMGGVVSDGESLYAATGNTRGGASWVGGEAIIRLTKGAAFPGTVADYFAPDNWASLDGADRDLGGSSPLVLDIPGGSPSKVVAAFGKDGVGYFRDRDVLGGVTGSGVASGVSDIGVVSAAASYRAPGGTYISVMAWGKSCPPLMAGELTTLRVLPTTPLTIETAWCTRINGFGSPIVTTTDGSADPIVWAVGAGQSNELHAFDGVTGDVIFQGVPADVMGNVQPRTSPIVVDGRIIAAGDDRVYVFTSVP